MAVLLGDWLVPAAWPACTGLGQPACVTYMRCCCDAYTAACAQSRDWKLQYAMATVGVVLSEKVDTTLSKGVLRILGTISGGVIGAPSASPECTRHIV